MNRTPEPRRVNGHAAPVPQVQVLSIALAMPEWQLVFRQLGEGSINQFLPVMQAMQGQLMAQLHTSQAPVQPTPQPGENDADEA